MEFYHDALARYRKLCGGYVLPVAIDRAMLIPSCSMTPETLALRL